MAGLLDFTTYSFLDLSGAIYHPNTGSYVFTGQGVGRIVISMSSEKTYHEFGVDGSVIVGRIPTESGKIVLDCQQTSNIHKWLLSTYQSLMITEEGNSTATVKLWAALTGYLRSLKDGTSHKLAGVSFEKVPDKVYAAEGQIVSWVLWAAEIESFAPNPSGAGQLSALAKQWRSRFE